MPASTSGPSRRRSTTRWPASASRIRWRSSSVLSSVEPLSLNLRFAQTSRASWRRDSIPCLYAARPKWSALDPSMSVLSRSKKAAPAIGEPRPARCGRGPGGVSPRLLSAVHLDDHGVALAPTGADGGHAEPAPAPPQLVHERHQDARAAGADRVAERDRAAVHVHLRLVDAEHAHRVERHRRERLVDLEQVDLADRQAGLLE